MSAAQAQLDGNAGLALARLIEAVNEMNEREERRAEYAHRLIAENMFAIVRLELAQATDQIINTALVVKRDRTGSGNAAFALNVTGTLVMLAGNVMSGGSMSLLGHLFVAVGEMAQAASKNDVFGFLTGATHLASGIVASSTTEGRAEFEKQRSGGMQMQQTSDLQGGQLSWSSSSGLTVSGQIETRSRTDGIAEMINTSGEGGQKLLEQLHERFKSEDKKQGGYSVVRKRTAWVAHGAGGSNAITFDVQDAISDAYGAGLTQIVDELKQIGRTFGGAPQMGPNTILGSIMSAPSARRDSLHPMTAWVLKRALETLTASGGTKYQALTGGSGIMGASTLTKAKRDVKVAFKCMSESSSGLPEVDTVRAAVKAANP